MAEQPGEGIEALAGRHFIQLLFDGALFMQGLHAHLHRIALHAAAHLGDPFRIGGGEEQGLPVPRGVADDPVDVFTKAHVQHAIRFVQHQRLEVVELKGALPRCLRIRPGVPTAMWAPKPRVADCGAVGCRRTGSPA